MSVSLSKGCVVVASVLFFGIGIAARAEEPAQGASENINNAASVSAGAGGSSANGVFGPRNIADEDYDIDETAFLKHGFVLDDSTDNPKDGMRAMVGEKFVSDIGKTVGREMPLEFSYNLVDLTGNGYNSLILWPRVFELYPKPDNQLQGGPLYVYVFDGKEWTKALQDFAVILGTKPHLDADGKPTGAQDIALVQDNQFRVFVYDEETGKYVQKGVSLYDESKREYGEVK